MLNKRGVEAIVATVLIVMITVAAVAILWAFVIPMVKDSLSSSTAEKVSLNIETDGGYTVYDSSTGYAFVQVKRGVDDTNLTGMRIIFFNGKETKAVSFEEIPTTNSQKVYAFDLNGFGEPVKVSVAPVFSEGKIGGVVSELSVFPSGSITEDEARNRETINLLSGLDAFYFYPLTSPNLVAHYSFNEDYEGHNVYLTSDKLDDYLDLKMVTSNKTKIEFRGSINVLTPQKFFGTINSPYYSMGVRTNEFYALSGGATLKVANWDLNTHNFTFDPQNSQACVDTTCISISNNAANGQPLIFYALTGPSQFSGVNTEYIKVWVDGNLVRNLTSYNSSCFIDSLSSEYYCNKGFGTFEPKIFADVAKDSSINSLDGLYKGGAYTTQGSFFSEEGVLVLDGSGDYVSIPGSTSFDSINARTISAWIKTTSIGTGESSNTILSRLQSVSPFNGFTLNVGRNTAGRLAYYSGGSWRESTSSNYNSGDWIHVGIVHNGTDVTIYKNGVPDGTFTDVAFSNFDTSLLIGQERDNALRNFNDSIDEVLIYNRSLSASEISQLYNSGNGRISVQ